MSLQPLEVNKGLLFHFIQSSKPELAKIIKEKQAIETMIIGLGRQGTNHTKLMRDYGTNIVCGVAPGRGGTFIHETIPVYNSAHEALKKHPNIAVASVWRHYSTAKDATIEAIEAGIPIIVLISEFIPMKDVRDILHSARQHNTLLFGGNTPGIIFPPERIKIGMLPNVFHPQEITPTVSGPKGVTIISRSGAILYHLSDALASVGIAQNAVLGVGGDGAIGTRFIDIVSKVMDYKNTDLVVIAGEIGGIQEEILAQDMQKHPQKYSKPLVALLSGANSPSGKTLGHAGAVVAPGQVYGTFNSKKYALELAGVKVVNDQWDLIKVVKEILQHEYFDPETYYKRMKELWEAKPPIPTWGTLITKVIPNNLIIRGYQLQDLIEKKSLIDVINLLFTGSFPDSQKKIKLESIIKQAINDQDIEITIPYNENKDDVSKIIGSYLLIDKKLITYSSDDQNNEEILAYTIGRTLKILAKLLHHEEILHHIEKSTSISEIIYGSIVGQKSNVIKQKLLESMIIACVDHGVTPPSAQTTILLASTRASFEVALSGGIHAITDVHGGAGSKACVFFQDTIELTKTENIDLEQSCFNNIIKIIKSGGRIEGLGHRIHTQDPRRKILLDLAEKSGIKGDCIDLANMLSDVFYQVKGMRLPINVDGVIGAIIGGMRINPITAKIIFVLGRIMGLTAHYFEEVQTQQPMRRINFEQARYKGEEKRSII